MQKYDEEKQDKFLGMSKNNWTKVGMLGRYKIPLEESVYEQDKYYAIKTMKIKAGFQQLTKCS